MIVTTKTRKQTAQHWPHHCLTGKWSLGGEVQIQLNNEHWARKMETFSLLDLVFRLLDFCHTASHLIIFIQLEIQIQTPLMGVLFIYMKVQNMFMLITEAVPVSPPPSL